MKRTRQVFWSLVFLLLFYFCFIFVLFVFYFCFIFVFCVCPESLFVWFSLRSLRKNRSICLSTFVFVCVFVFVFVFVFNEAFLGLTDKAIHEAHKAICCVLLFCVCFFSFYSKSLCLSSSLFLFFVAVSGSFFFICLFFCLTLVRVFLLWLTLCENTSMRPSTKRTS